jgi:hypothetical protein
VPQIPKGFVGMRSLSRDDALTPPVMITRNLLWLGHSQPASPKAQRERTDTRVSRALRPVFGGKSR